MLGLNAFGLQIVLEQMRPLQDNCIYNLSKTAKKLIFNVDYGQNVRLSR